MDTTSSLPRRIGIAGLQGGLMAAATMFIYYGPVTHHWYMIPGVIVLPFAGYFGGWLCGRWYERRSATR